MTERLIVSREARKFKAAADATSYSLKLPNTDQKKLKLACSAGARAVIATPAELAALTKALAPVYTRIERDGKTKSFVSTIRALKRRRLRER